MVHFALPCSFFFRAPDEAKRKILKGSGLAMARAALRIFNDCVQFGIAWTLEHPEGSRIWTWPPLHRVLRSCVCFVVLTGCCQCGMHYRKPAFLCQYTGVHRVGSDMPWHTFSRRLSRQYHDAGWKTTLVDVACMCICSQPRTGISPHRHTHFPAFRGTT